MIQIVCIVGMVEYCEGDGLNIVICCGLVMLEMGVNDVMLSWVDEEIYGLVVMFLIDFNFYVVEGVIVLDL